MSLTILSPHCAGVARIGNVVGQACDSATLKSIRLRLPLEACCDQGRVAFNSSVIVDVRPRCVVVGFVG